MPSPRQTPVEVWKKRVDAAEKLHKKWEEEDRVQAAYDYWRGDQLKDPLDEFGVRRAQINKIHPEVRNAIPSLYYYSPFARVTAAPEKADDPGTTVEADTALMQDTVNHLIRDQRTMFRDSTLLALKESFWALGCVEVGYSAEFVDAPNAPDKPPLKEKKDTKVGPPVKDGSEAARPDLLAAASAAGAPPEMTPTSPVPTGLEGIGGGMGVEPMGGSPMGGPPPMDLGAPAPDPMSAIMAEIDALKSELKSETFYVKHIPANRILVSTSDMPILESNDWIGYWEDVPLEDVKRCRAYSNTTGLKPSTDDASDRDRMKTRTSDETDADPDKVRLFKLWDLRRRERIVMAKGHDKFLLREGFKRCPLKFLRFDVDPYHFYPRPLLLSKLGPQDEYNESREYLRKIRVGTVPRYTYDEDGIEVKHLRKLESGAMGTYVPRRTGTSNVIEPIQQPSYSENAIQTLTLSDKEFADVGGVGPDPRVAQSKTATQAKIGEAKDLAQDNFDRAVVAKWLSDVSRELLALAIDHMNVDQWVAVNVVPESQFSMQIGQQVASTFQRVNASLLSDTAQGIIWDVVIDIENLSPVSQEERFQKLMQGLQLMANPPMARLFSVSPELLKYTLEGMGIRSGKEIDLITGAVQQVVQMEQMLAAQSQNAAPGISPMPGGSKPGAGPTGPGPGPTPPSPQPTGPTGPSASAPKPPQPVGAPVR